MGRKLNIKEGAALVNQVCPTIQNVSSKEIYNLFSENKIPYYATLIPYFVSKGYFDCSNNLYSWVKREPVYYKEIEPIILAEIKKRKSHYESKKRILSEENAIAFLKSKGYKIMKPITEYEEV